MQAIDFPVFVPCKPDNVSLHYEMVLVQRLQWQTRCRPLFDEYFVSVDCERECRSSLVAKPVPLKRCKLLRRWRPLLRGNEASDFTIGIHGFSRHRLAVPIESKLQLILSRSEFPASH